MCVYVYIKTIIYGHKSLLDLINSDRYMPTIANSFTTVARFAFSR